ncbi:proteasome subunit beta type-4 like protein [Verticillium longisporum]|nr:proteasome subunit beta type-4 like protein [Verticillium longisporum]
MASMFEQSGSGTLFLGGQKISGSDIRDQNVLATQAIANVVKSSFGPSGLDKMMVDDIVQFAEYIQANAQLYSMRNETDLSPSAISHFVRGELASSLRSRKPCNVNLLLGGVDPITLKPALYWMDYLASMAPVPYAAHGYAQYYCLSILDKHHHPDITLGQGIKILNMCTDELKRRMPIDFKGMLVKAVTKDGVIDIEFDDDKVVKSA